MIDSSILNVLMETTVNWLSSQLIEDVADDSKVGLLRAGKLQDDPTLHRMNLLIQVGDRDWRHVRAPASHHALQLLAPYSFEMGERGEFWLRRFVVKFQLFFDGEEVRSVAQTLANIILARTETALLAMPLNTGADSFGETPLQLDIEDSFLSESGGSGEFIHRGEIRVEFLTERLGA